MITRVRVAPVERWCENSRMLALKRPQPNPEVGLEVEIISESMHMAGFDEEGNCGGRYWDLTNKSANELMVRVSGPPVSRFKILTICEHQLEMD
jgi:hypothetical protein